MSETVPVPSTAQPKSHWRRYRPLYALLAVCVAPVVASYLAYYVSPPEGRTNYGDLLNPQQPAVALSFTTLEGAPADWQTLRGNWVMVQLADADCDDVCRARLWKMRQVRTATGKDRDRIERVWLVTNSGAPATALIQEFGGTQLFRTTPESVRTVFAAAAASDAAADSATGLAATTRGAVADHIWLVDPLGNVMLRWPANADPNRMKKDLSRVLRASRIG